MIDNLHIVTLTTASGHTFTYSFNPVTIANALVKLEQSQLYAERKAALEATTPLPATDGATTE